MTTKILPTLSMSSYLDKWKPAEFESSVGGLVGIILAPQTIWKNTNSYNYPARFSLAKIRLRRGVVFKKEIENTRKMPQRIWKSTNS